MNKKIVIEVSSGVIEVVKRLDNIDIELHDYDINEIEKDNPDRNYGRDGLGDYEITIL